MHDLTLPASTRIRALTGTADLAWTQVGPDVQVVGDPKSGVGAALAPGGIGRQHRAAAGVEVVADPIAEIGQVPDPLAPSVTTEGEAAN